MNFIKELELSTGHRLSLHKGGCYNFHGHNYQVKVSINFRDEISLLFIDNIGYYIDFSVVKQVLNEQYDHRFLMWVKDPLKDKIDSELLPGLRLVTYSPTVENISKEMAAFLEEGLRKEIKNNEVEYKGIIEIKLEVYETSKSRVITKHQFTV